MNNDIAFSAVCNASDRAISTSISPDSNTGISSTQSTELGHPLHLAGAGSTTIIDTCTLVFPLESLVPDFHTVTFDVDESRISPSEASRLPFPVQHKHASAWYARPENAGRGFVSDQAMVEAWVNTLFRLSVSNPLSTVQPDSAYDQVLPAFDMLLGGFGFILRPEYKGINGFRFSASILPAEWNFFRDGQPPLMGQVAWGGITNKEGVSLAQINLTGQGCACITQLDDGWRSVHSFAVDANAHITRLDIALDDLEGAHGTPETWLEKYESGQFSLRQKPSHQLIRGDSGTTLYVGTRESGKLCRIYMKGQQLGDADSLWCRIEVELRSKQRVIPLLALVEPDSYFSGSYPALSNLHVSIDERRIDTVKRTQAACTIRALTEHAKRSYGGLVNVFKTLGMSADEIVDRLWRNAVPSRLKDAAFVSSLCPAPG